MSRPIAKDICCCCCYRNRVKLKCPSLFRLSKKEISRERPFSYCCIYAARRFNAHSFRCYEAAMIDLHPLSLIQDARPLSNARRARPVTDADEKQICVPNFLSLRSCCCSWRRPLRSHCTGSPDPPAAACRQWPQARQSTRKGCLTCCEIPMLLARQSSEQCEKPLTNGSRKSPIMPPLTLSLF